MAGVAPLRHLHVQCDKLECSNREMIANELASVLSVLIREDTDVALTRILKEEVDRLRQIYLEHVTVHGCQAGRSHVTDYG